MSLRIPLLLLLLVMPCMPVYGKGQLQAGPILLQIEAGQRASRLRLANTGDSKLVAQVRVFAWSQKQGEDRLTLSDEVVVSPPIVELAPGSEQMVRVVRLGPEARGHDRSYRLVVDELPRDEADSRSVVSVRMRYVLPLFVRAEDAAQEQLSCVLQGGSLACINSGGRAAQLGATRLTDGERFSLTLSDGLFGYVLPGSRRIWALPQDFNAPVSNGLRLETRLNGRPATLSIQL